MTPRDAFFSDHERVPAAAAIGRIAELLATTAHGGAATRLFAREALSLVATAWSSPG